MAPKTSDPQALPTKEQGLFRTLIKQYESKLYKKGVKTADTILKKFPDNGETLSMKGLLLNCLHRKQEAYDLVKRGVKANIRSHVCWHVYGLLYRSDREYDEAIKCYKNSLRMDRDNLTVLRDLAQLQIQMRDLAGFLETRQTLLDLKSSNRQHWVAFALAHHMLGNYEVAATVLDSYETTLDDGTAPTGSDVYEHSEIVLYKASILAEGGKAAEALVALDRGEAAGIIRDKLGAAELRAKLLLETGKHVETEALYRRLLRINPENYKYHQGLQSAVSQNDDNYDALITVYKDLQSEYPHSTAVKRIPLDFLTGEAFTSAVDVFVRKYLSKGIPSLFSELRPLYKESEKASALEELFLRLESSLESSGTFPPPPGSGDSGTVHTRAAGPQALVWTRLYLALHYDRLNNVEDALRYVDACIAHTPTLIEAHSARARILKHAGDAAGAAVSAERAREMDLADRYLNCKAVKALFRADRCEEAEATAQLFTRDGEQNNNLFDMQATWYEVASGRAYAARGDLGRALKRFLKVDAHFADFVEDQFDFHGYCVRKQTMRAYVDMLRMEDRMYAHPMYGKAAYGAIQAYVRLYDNPPGTRKEQEVRILAEMGDEEAKQFKLEKKKADAKKKKEELATAAAAALQKKKKGDAKSTAAAVDKAKEDADPDGEALVATTDPLGEATKLVKKLKAAASDCLETHLLAFEVYSRKGRLLLALQAVEMAMKLAGTAHPKVHSAAVKLAKLVEDTPSEPVDEHIATSVPKDHVAVLLGGATVEEFHAVWTETHAGTSLAHGVTAAQLTAWLHPVEIGTASAALAMGGTAGGSHAECVEVLKWLQEVNPACISEFRRSCAEVFPWSRELGGAKCVPLPMQNSTHDGCGCGEVDGVGSAIGAVNGLHIHDK